MRLATQVPWPGIGGDHLLNRTRRTNAKRFASPCVGEPIQPGEDGEGNDGAKRGEPDQMTHRGPDPPEPLDQNRHHRDEEDPPPYAVEHSFDGGASNLENSSRNPHPDLLLVVPA